MYEWNEQERMIQQAIRSFIDQEIRPHRDELEFGDMPPYDLLRKMFNTFGIGPMALAAFNKRIERLKAGDEASSEDGPDDGMGGLDETVMGLMLTTELCRVVPGFVGAMGVSIGLAAGTIQARGTIEQQERWVPDLLTMDKVGAWAITEPNSGSDAFGGMVTSARPEGDGWVLNGNKTFITNGPYADTIILYAKLDNGAPIRERPILTFVLDADMEGLERSKPMRKMGFHSSPTGELFLTDVFAGPDRLLGGETDPTSDEVTADAGRDSARSNFTAERVAAAAMSLGIIEECLQLSIEYARTCERWGKPIGEYQLIQEKLARMEIARVNVQNMVFATIERHRDGRQPTLAEASAMKLYAARAATEVAMEAVQLHGGNGYMSEYRVEQLARDAKSIQIYAGTDEIQITHIAKDLLRR